jgi:hypothetical protein
VTSGGYLDLTVIVLAGLIILGVAFDLFHRVVKPRQPAPWSIAQSRRWEKRLSQLHVIEDSGGESVTVLR